MTTSTATVPERVSARTAVWTLARAEGWRLVRHPVFLGSLALTLLTYLAGFGGDPAWPTQQLTEMTGLTWAFLPAGVAVAAGWTLTRESGEEAWFPGAPLDGRQRATGRLLALLWPTGVVAVAVLAAWVRTASTGGIPTGDLLTAAESAGRGGGLGTRDVVPDLFTMACIPAAVLMVGAGAFALASWSRMAGTVIAAFGALVTGAISWAFAGIFWVTPFVQNAFELDQGRGYDPSSAGAGTILLRPDEYRGTWAVVELSPAVSAAHLVFLVALAGLWGALALHLAGRKDLANPAQSRRVRLLAVGSAVVVVGAVAAQIVLTPS